MIPPFDKVVSEDPFDDTDEGRAYWAEAAAIEAWMNAGAPDPMTMWQELQRATDSPTPDSSGPRLKTAPDVRKQGLASIEDACTFLGGISRDTFDKHVRREVKLKHVGSRPFVVVDSLVAYFETDAFKSLKQ